MNRIGKDQTEALISYMEQHSLFARGQICKLGAQGHVKYKKMWNDLTNVLNHIGPSHKDVAAWQKCWTNMRLSAKLKKANFIKESTKTGHNTPDIVFSENECRISGIYGKYGTGLNLGKELGFHWIEHPNFEDEFLFDSLVLSRPSSLVTESLYSYLNFTPSRINDIFDELNQHLLNLQVNNIDRKRVQKKPTDQQIRCLIDFMERHEDFANGRAENAEELWRVLLTLLHANRGPEKTLAAWKRTWSGLITAARQNMRFLLDGRKETPMSANHIKIIDIVGYKEDNSNISYENPSCTRSSYDKVHASSSTDSSFCKQLPTSSDSTFSRPYEPPRFTNWNNRPSNSTSNNLYEPSTSTNWNNDQPSTSTSSYEQPSTAKNWNNDRPTTSRSSSYEQPSASIDFCDEPSASNYDTASNSRCSQSPFDPRFSLCREPVRKMPRVENPVTTTTTVRNTSRTPPSTASASATDKSAKLIEALEQKGQDLVQSLANQLMGCFEKQNDVLAKGLKSLSDTVMRTLPSIIAEEFQKLLKNVTLISNDAKNEEDTSTLVANDTIENVLFDETDNQSCDEVFQLVKQSVMSKDPKQGKCAICQDDIISPKEIECKHIFCMDCIDTWLQHSNCCPICRKNVLKKNVTWDDIVPYDSDDDL